MSKAFANPKLFAAATILFAVATFVNLSITDTAVNPLMSAPAPSQGEELKANPVSPSRLTLVAAVR